MAEYYNDDDDDDDDDEGNITAVSYTHLDVYKRQYVHIVCKLRDSTANDSKEILYVQHNHLTAVAFIYISIWL